MSIARLYQTGAMAATAMGFIIGIVGFQSSDPWRVAEGGIILLAAIACGVISIGCVLFEAKEK